MVGDDAAELEAGTGIDKGMGSEGLPLGVRGYDSDG